VISIVAAQPAVSLAEPAEHGLQREREERRDDEGDEGELDRVVEQDDDRADDLRHALERLRHELRDERLRLLGVAQYAGDDLPGLRALEVAEREALEVAEHAVAEVAGDVLLE
jgi:hypothetical protein